MKKREPGRKLHERPNRSEKRKENPSARCCYAASALGLETSESWPLAMTSYTAMRTI